VRPPPSFWGHRLVPFEGPKQGLLLHGQPVSVALMFPALSWEIAQQNEVIRGGNRIIE